MFKRQENDEIIDIGPFILSILKSVSNYKITYSSRHNKTISNDSISGCILNFVHAGIHNDIILNGRTLNQL
jgi:hypothetical protein